MEHVNPLDSNLNESDVEIFEPQPTSVEFLNPIENEVEASVEPEAAVEPVAEVALEPVAEPQHDVKVWKGVFVSQSVLILEFKLSLLG